MPAIAEDERDSLEERRLAEAERLRLEEEARLLAEQQALAAQQTLPPIPQGNYMNQPRGEIDAIQAQFNEIAQGRGLPAPRTTDSQQYLDEVASAQRNSGFINANVSDFGEVISAGYDPERDPRAIVARQEATNLQRNQYINSLEQGGATYAEALRAGLGKYPRKGDENLRLKIEQLAQKQNTPLMQPEVVTIDGVKALRTGPNSFSRVPEPRTAVAGGPTMPRDAVASQKIISGQITDARAALTRAQKAVEENRQDVTAVNAAIRAREKLRGLEQSLVTGSTNWMGAAQAPAPIPVAPTAATPAQAKAVNEIVRMTKDGKRAVYDAETKEFIRYL